MLEYDRLDISEVVEVNKISLSKECDICHYWYFKDIGFKYETYLCNNIAIVYIKENAYRIHFWYMSKDDAINIMNGSNLVDKRDVL